MPAAAQVEVRGDDPLLESRHHPGEAAAAAIGLAGAWSAHIGEIRGGPAQAVRVELVDAAASLLGFLYQRAGASDLTRKQNPLTALYPTSPAYWPDRPVAEPSLPTAPMYCESVRRRFPASSHT